MVSIAGDDDDVILCASKAAGMIAGLVWDRKNSVFQVFILDKKYV